MKFDQLIKYSVRNTFLKNQAENEIERLVLELALFLKKGLFKL